METGLIRNAYCSPVIVVLMNSGSEEHPTYFIYNIIIWERPDTESLKLNFGRNVPICVSLTAPAKLKVALIFINSGNKLFSHYLFRQEHLFTNSQAIIRGG